MPYLGPISTRHYGSRIAFEEQQGSNISGMILVWSNTLLYYKLRGCKPDWAEEHTVTTRLVVLESKSESALEFIFAGLGLGLGHPQFESFFKSAYSCNAAQCDNNTGSIPQQQLNQSQSQTTWICQVANSKQQAKAIRWLQVQDECYSRHNWICGRRAWEILVRWTWHWHFLSYVLAWTP